MSPNSMFSMYDRVSDENVELQIDEVSRAQVQIEVEHHMLHKGHLFRRDIINDIPNGGSISIGVKTANSLKDVNFRFQIGSEGELIVRFYENPTSVSGGTSLSLKSANRQSENVPETSITLNPTYVLGGADEIYTEHLGSGHQVGGELDEHNEWILKHNTNYLFVISNLGSQANHTAVHITLYEHEPYFEPQ